MVERTIFDEIVDGNIPSWKVWEDERYLAFLTPFANTPGLTVVIPKKNPGDYVFDLDDQELASLMAATKKVAGLLKQALGVKKVGLVFEGEGVAHVHAKLYPMHGDLTPERLSALAHHQEFYPEYPGYISTVEGPRMSDAGLTEIQQKIQAAAKSK
ncbi:MAG TPA: HIT family protein [Candidatus Saccharimonadales bacterium]